LEKNNKKTKKKEAKKKATSHPQYGNTLAHSKVKNPKRYRKRLRKNLSRRIKSKTAIRNLKRKRFKYVFAEQPVVALTSVDAGRQRGSVLSYVSALRNGVTI
jgi:hypothetical protein